MSVQKLHYVERSRKNQGKCGKCGDPLPTGISYRWWSAGFRSRGKHVRCAKTACFPRASERETSKTRAILEAQESFEDNLPGLGSPDDITEAVHEVATAVQEVADEYQEALYGWENGNEQLQEKVDHYEDQTSELENWSWDGDDEPELCDKHSGRQDDADEDDSTPGDCDDCIANRDEWLGNVRDAASDAVQGIDFL